MLSNRKFPNKIIEKWNTHLKHSYCYAILEFALLVIGGFIEEGCLDSPPSKKKKKRKKEKKGSQEIWNFSNFQLYLALQILGAPTQTSMHKVSTWCSGVYSSTNRRPFIGGQNSILNVCGRQMSVSAIFLLNRITVTIFQIIHIRNKTLDPCIKGGLERRSKV